MPTSVIHNAAKRWIQLWVIYFHRMTRFDTLPEVIDLVIQRDDHLQQGNGLIAGALTALIDEMRGNYLKDPLRSIQLMQIELNQHDVYLSVLSTAHALENQYPNFVLCQLRGLYGE